MNWHIRINGKGGLPFIWAHGLMGSIALDDATGYFYERNSPCLTQYVRYDARGHGFTDATDNIEDYTWPNLANDMIAIADKLGANCFIAGGQSMGSMTALYAARMVPERVKALVLVTPSTVWETRKEQAKIYRKSAEIIETKGVDTFVQILRERTFLPDWLLQAKPNDMEKYIKSMLIIGEDHLSVILRAASISDLPPKKEFTPPAVPTLILAWVDDPTHPLQSAEELREKIPDAKMIVARNQNDLQLWPQTIKDFVAGVCFKEFAL